MAYDRYAVELTDKDGQIYGVMDAEAREEVGELNSALVYDEEDIFKIEKDVLVRDATSQNIFGERWTNGYKLENGVATYDSAYQADLHYYPYSGDSFYFLQSSVGIAARVCFYNENLTYLSTVTFGNATSGQKSSPTGAKYFRFSVYKTSGYTVAIGYSSFSSYVACTFNYKLKNQAQLDALESHVDDVEDYAEEIETTVGKIIDDTMIIVPTTQNIFNENWDRQNYDIVNGDLHANTGYQATSWYLPFTEAGLYFIQTSVAIACQVHFYNASKTYIQSKALGNNLSGGMSAPAGTAFLRFSVYITNNWHLAICGATAGAFQEYVPYDFKYVTVDENTSFAPIFYKISEFPSAGSGKQIEVASKYGNNYDIINRLWTRIDAKNKNNFFDFAQTLVKSNSSAFVSSDLTGATSFNENTGTEWHAPYKVVADNNGGTDTGYFTGGGHASNNDATGEPTLTLQNLRFFANGKEVFLGDSGYCDLLEITWTNLIQGSNTETGSGITPRNILQENHRLVFDGIVWKDYTEIIALEDLHIKLWYGLQMAGVKTCYPNYRFLGDSNTKSATTPTALASGGDTCYKMICWGTDHRLEVEVDISKDLGRRLTYHGENGAFHLADTNKCYFTIINDETGVAMEQGDMFTLYGSYRFMPNIW